MGPLVFQTLLSWQGTPAGKKRKKFWLATLLCLFWTVWQERNRVVFENRVTLDQRTKVIFFSNLWSWVNSHNVDNMNSLLEFLGWLGCW